MVQAECLQAGSVVTDTGHGAQLPNGFVPTSYCDPLDADAVTKFYNAGPQIPRLIRAQWTGVPVGPPVTYWKPDPNASPGNPSRQYVLTGLGAALPFLQLCVNAACFGGVVP